jgi:hypothetical protein
METPQVTKAGLKTTGSLIQFNYPPSDTSCLVLSDATAAGLALEFAGMLQTMTAINCSTITNLYSLQFTTAHRI